MIYKEGLVSVLMSCYNSENTIQKSIESILDQTYKDFELLIMNDASTDNTFEILKNYEIKSKKIKIFSNKVNIGLTKSLNILINESRGEFIARQDADDESFKNRINVQITAMKDKNLDFCTSRAIIKNSKRKIPNISYYLPSKLVSIYKNPFIHGTLIFKKESLDRVGNYDENFYYSQDYKLIDNMLKNKFKYKKLYDVLYKLNMENNISTNYQDQQKYFANCVRKNEVPDINKI